jgi:hypothetical protein
VKVLKCAAGLLAATALGFGIYRLESRRPLAELERAGISVIADDDGIIQSVAFQHVDASETYLNYVARLKSVNSVFLCNRHVTSDGLAALAALSRLRRLDLSNSHADAGSLAAVGRIGSLQFLNLAHCSWVSDDELARLLPSPRLESLQLEDCPITDAGLAHLCRLSSLRSLGLSDCTAVSDAGVLSLSALPRLEDVTLDGLQLTQNGLQGLKLFPALRTVSLRGIRVARQDLLPLMSGRSSLVIDLNGLELQELAPLYELGASVRLNARLEPAAVSLGETGSEGRTPLNDRTLGILQQFPTVEVLSLSGAPVSDEGLQIVGQLMRLQDVRLQDLPITDHGLEELAALTALNSLSVYQCAVTGEGVVAFRDRALESLAIHSSTALTSDGLRHIGGVSALRSLRIHGPLPAQGWDSIAQLPHLDNLSLLGGVLTGDVAEALTRSRSLVRLRLQDSEVRDESFPAWTALPPAFRLELANCRFSREMLQQLSEARPDLSVSEDFFHPRMMMPR